MGVYWGILLYSRSLCLSPPLSPHPSLVSVPLLLSPLSPSLSLPSSPSVSLAVFPPPHAVCSLLKLGALIETSNTMFYVFVVLLGVRGALPRDKGRPNVFCSAHVVSVVTIAIERISSEGPGRTAHGREETKKAALLNSGRDVTDSGETERPGREQRSQRSWQRF